MAITTKPATISSAVSACRGISNRSPGPVERPFRDLVFLSDGAKALAFWIVNAPVDAYRLLAA